jgi:long-chain-fatty-acid--[acyl-carrier-protein] ligase
MDDLVDRLTAAMTSSPHHLHLANADGESWTAHPWGEVYVRAENFAEAVGGTPAVALIGEPTVELLAAVYGSWLAGASVALLPGPVRGADSTAWAHATIQRCRRIGIASVHSHGARLVELQSVADELPVHDVARSAHPRRSTSLTPAVTGLPAILQGTAGSTGSPKTAQLSHSAVLANIDGITARVNVDRDRDAACSWLPLYHDMGLILLLAATACGLPLWQAPTSAFSAMPFRWLRWLEHSGATITAAPNFAYNVLGKYAGRVPDVDLSRIRFALNGGEPVDCGGMSRFADEMARLRFDADALAPSYGMAESACAVTIPDPGRGLRFDEVAVADGSPARRHALLGTPIAGMQVRVSPVDGPVSEAASRDVGEIEVRGTSMMDGYLGEPPLDAGDWFRTGDLGYLTDDGLVVCGRAKELITVAGRNVFPSEVERIAGQVPGVREGSVIAVEAGGQATRPGLVITAEFRGEQENETRIQLVRKVAAECGVMPAQVLFVAPGTLPRTSSGKLRRLEVKRTLDAGAAP